jgi:hypothetical protein
VDCPDGTTQAASLAECPAPTTAPFVPTLAPTTQTPTTPTLSPKEIYIKTYCASLENVDACTKKHNAKQTEEGIVKYCERFPNTEACTKVNAEVARLQALPVE